MPRFVRSIRIHAPVERVYEFHLNVANVVRVAPPGSHTKLVSYTHERLEVGARVCVRSVQAGIPVRIEAEVIDLSPPNLLRDKQLSGPFATWIHTHRFEPEGDDTRLTDEVEYSLPLGPLGGLVMGRVVSRELAETFQFRQEKTQQLIEAGEDNVPE